MSNNNQPLELIMYTQPHCSLCDDAKIQLEAAREEIPFTYREIDINQDDELMERWQIRVPVITYQDVIIQEGIIDFVTVVEELNNLIKD